MNDRGTCPEAIVRRRDPAVGVRRSAPRRRHPCAPGPAHAERCSRRPGARGRGLVALIAARLHRLDRAVQTGWDTASALVFRPRVGELLINTVLLEAAHRADRHRACGGARLADRAHRSAAARGCGRWLAVAPLGDPGLRAQLCLGQPVPVAARPVRPACWSRCSPISRSSICRSRRSCAGSTRRSRMPPPRSASTRGRSSFASCCRSCGWPSAAARCWSACICWPNTASTS